MGLDGDVDLLGFVVYLGVLLADTEGEFVVFIHLYLIQIGEEELLPEPPRTHIHHILKIEIPHIKAQLIRIQIVQYILFKRFVCHNLPRHLRDLPVGGLLADHPHRLREGVMHKKVILKVIGIDNLVLLEPRSLLIQVESLGFLDIDIGLFDLPDFAEFHGVFVQRDICFGLFPPHLMLTLLPKIEFLIPLHLIIQLIRYIHQPAHPLNQLLPLLEKVRPYILLCYPIDLVDDGTAFEWGLGGVGVELAEGVDVVGED